MDYKETINKIRKCGQDFGNRIIEDIPETITEIAKYYQITDEDMREIFDVTPDNSDRPIDLGTLALLTLLSGGKLNVFTEKPDGKELNEINTLMKEYHDAKYPEPELTRKDKLMKVLDLLGVKDDESLDTLLESLKDVNKIIDNFNLKDEEKCCKDECCCKKTNNTTESKPERMYVDANGNFHSQKSYNASDSDTVKVKGAYYDSETMDDPQSFTIDLNKLLGTNITFDKVMNFLRNINKNLQ